jgi:hypothetical protein
LGRRRRHKECWAAVRHPRLDALLLDIRKSKIPDGEKKIKRDTGHVVSS